MLCGIFNFFIVLAINILLYTVHSRNNQKGGSCGETKIKYVLTP